MPLIVIEWNFLIVKLAAGQCSRSVVIQSCKQDTHSTYWHILQCLSYALQSHIEQVRQSKVLFVISDNYYIIECRHQNWPQQLYFWDF